MFRLLALVLGLALALPAAAQDDQTLADIRQELSVLFVDIQRLKRELSTTAAPSGTGAGGSVLERVDAIEMELQRLTAKTEQLEFRVNQVVSDGTNRIGDLEFRLCELEADCDIASLGEGSTLGGGAAPATPVAPAAPAPQTDVSQLAVGEAEDFQRASEALASGDFRAAADQLATFNETYPGSPVAVKVDLMRGEALEGLGDMTSAARAYLNAFSGDPNGADAPRALYKLGASLGALGQTNEACVTLAEVQTRFPTSASVADAQAAQSSFGCS
ncbi:tol-pal system protein YbgF [Cognatishimia sp. MH4019]|uniref:tol-pal system protein YbgF n=1 Tax=Cognatishimia sp. MH4019 TaxID=2854030 RepID=UPI001CD60A90|nr:tol-pal system protein YbgF [Cognatishimia sp. MH4019]